MADGGFLLLWDASGCCHVDIKKLTSDIASAVTMLFNGRKDPTMKHERWWTDLAVNSKEQVLLFLVTVFQQCSMSY